MQHEGKEIVHIHGNFEDNLPHGPCVKVSDSLLFEGEMLHNEFHGEGSLVTRGASALTYKVYLSCSLGILQLIQRLRRGVLFWARCLVTAC